MNRLRLAAAGWVIAVALIAAPPSHAQPYLVRNINDAENGFRSDSDPFVLGVVNGQVIFSAADLEHGREPWATDGTAAGTRLLADTIPGSAHSFGAFRFAAVGERLLLKSGNRFFSTDGTPEGTVRLAFDTLGLSEPYNDETVHGTLEDPPRLLLSQRVIGGDQDIWVTDGTPEGTRLVLRLNFARNGGVSFGNEVVFVYGSSELWKSDGTRAGTVPVRSFESIDLLVVLDEGRAILAADDGVAGTEIWVTDGTPAGTRLVEDLRPGPDGSSPELVGAATGSGRVFFLLRDPFFGTLSLWSTDGTAAGTFALTSELGLFGFSPQVDGMLFAQAGDGVHGVELLASDGTPAGTRLLDICPGSCSSFPGGFTATSIGILFGAFDTEGGGEPWLTDGTAAGTQRLADLCPGSCSSGARFLADLGGEVVLYSSSTRRAWVSYGPTAGTLPLPLPSGLVISQSATAGVVDGVAVFGASDDLHGAEPWRTDGTAAGTFRLGDLARDGDRGSIPARFEEFAGEAFFAASVGSLGSSGRELWRTDGTEAGTRPFTALDSDGDVIDLLAFGSDLFVLTRHDLRTEVWRTDGTAAGTVQIFADDLPGSFSCCDAGFAAVGGRLYVLGPGLWRTGRTPGSARKVADLTFSEEAIEQGPGLLGGRLYFSATASPVGGEADFELWSSDGTPGGTRRVRDLWPGGLSSNPRDFAALAGRLYFIAKHDFGLQSLWRTDGTGTGTEALLEVDFAEGRILGVAGGRIVVYDGETLWATDGADFAELGTASGEMGSLGSAAAVPFAGRLFFIAGLDDFGTSNSRLWATVIGGRKARFSGGLEARFSGGLGTRGDVSHRGVAGSWR